MTVYLIVLLLHAEDKLLILLDTDTSLGKTVVVCYFSLPGHYIHYVLCKYSWSTKIYRTRKILVIHLINFVN